MPRGWGARKWLRDMGAKRGHPATVQGVKVAGFGRRSECLI